MYSEANLLKKIHGIDISIIVIYLIVCICIAVNKFKSIKTLKEYTLERGYFSDIVVISVIFSAHIGAGAIVGSVEQIYKLGVFFAIPWVMFVIFLATYGQSIRREHKSISRSHLQ
ncbi:MAG: hypothetical protein MRQ09_03015 [Candidatus Midichloria sp.]|nr:hypothetical protein [Candidatus Midichloria sp.]